MKSKKGKSYIWGNIYFGIIFFSCLSSSMSQISFNLFCSGDNKLLSEFLRNWVWFHKHNERFPNILAKNWNFKKLRHGFVDERTLITTTLIYFCLSKTLVPFLRAKEKTWKRIFNTNSELSQNRTEKQIMPFKTTVNWLFTDIWCYLVIGCFDWKIVLFRQTVVKVYYILK